MIVRMTAGAHEVIGDECGRLAARRDERGTYQLAVLLGRASLSGATRGVR